MGCPVLIAEISHYSGFSDLHGGKDNRAIPECQAGCPKIILATCLTRIKQAAIFTPDTYKRSRPMTDLSDFAATIIIWLAVLATGIVI